MARSDPQVNIRMPSELKTLLESAAADTKRSLNAEILTRLFDTFYKGEAEGVAAIRATVEQQAKLIQAMKGQIEAKDELLSKERQLISLVGMFLRILGERTDEWSDASFREAMAAFRHAGNYFAHREIEDGINALMKAIYAGTGVEVSHEFEDDSSAEIDIRSLIPTRVSHKSHKKKA